MKKFRGDFLRELRKKKGLSQAQTGKVAGVAGPTVGTWERGVSAPSAPTVKMLAEYFGVEESDFWESPAPSVQSDRDIYHPKTRGDILRLIRALADEGACIDFDPKEPEEFSLSLKPASEQLRTALFYFTVLYNTVRYGPGEPVLDTDKAYFDALKERDWQNIFDTWMEQTLAELDKIPLDKEETPAPEE